MDGEPKVEIKPSITLADADKQSNEIWRKIDSHTVATGTPIKGVVYRGEHDETSESKTGRYLTTSQHLAQQYAEQYAARGNDGARVAAYEFDFKNPVVGVREEVIEYLGKDDPEWTQKVHKAGHAIIYEGEIEDTRARTAVFDEILAKKAKSMGHDGMILDKLGAFELVDLTPVILEEPQFPESKAA